MKIALGSDEANELTRFLIEELGKRGHTIVLRGPLGGRRQIRLVDEALVTLHPRNMRIAKERNPTGRQRQHTSDGVPHALDRLFRQSVHEIDIDLANAGAVQPLDGACRFGERLDPVDRLLNLGIDVLNAEAGSRHAGARQRLNLGPRKPARIDLDRELRIRHE